jgi:hypothetical protein
MRWLLASLNGLLLLSTCKPDAGGTSAEDRARNSTGDMTRCVRPLRGVFRRYVMRPTFALEPSATVTLEVAEAASGATIADAIRLVPSW